MSRLLGGGGELGDLMRRARLIDQAQRHLRDHLPGELGEHLFVGGFHQGRLTLITDRAVWLTRLRYEQPRLLGLLHQLPAFAAVTGFDLKVRPVRPPKAPPRQTRRLTSRAADELSSCAADVDDPGLKRALERLASHAEREP
ncbi:DciA family protein [Halomonas organivorans]